MRGKNNMVNQLKRVFKSIFICFVLGMVSSNFQAIFKKDWYGKSVYISPATCKFLKITVPEFEKWFYRLKCGRDSQVGSLRYCGKPILDFLRSFRNSDKIEGKDIEQLGELLSQAHTVLISEMKNKDFSDNNRHLHKLIKEIGIDLSVAVRQVYIGTAEADLKVIDNYLRHPQSDYAVHVYGLIQDIIKHFDGVAVTEYDFVVLASCALFVLFSVE
jgi:hypothetical protein